MSIEDQLGISGIGQRREAPRAGLEDLDRIKRFSDENIEIIKNSFNKASDESKRSLVVNLIAALDYYFHEIVLWGIIQITQDGYEKGINYNNFLISINFITISRSGISDIQMKEKLREEVIKRLKKETYQKWKSIRDGLKVVLPKEYNTRVAGLAISSDKPNGVFHGDKLRELNDIRDNLVHSFGRNYSENSIRNDIDIDGEDSIILIETIINSIHGVFLDYEASHS